MMFAVDEGRIVSTRQSVRPGIPAPAKTVTVRISSRSGGLRRDRLSQTADVPAYSHWSGPRRSSSTGNRLPVDLGGILLGQAAVGVWGRLDSLLDRRLFNPLGRRTVPRMVADVPTVAPANSIVCRGRVLGPGPR
jgi:hypothetical protein